MITRIKHTLLTAAIALGVILMLIVSAIDTLFAQNDPTRPTVAEDDSPPRFDPGRGGISSVDQDAKGAAGPMTTQPIGSGISRQATDTSGVAHPEPVAGSLIDDTYDLACLVFAKQGLGQIEPVISAHEIERRMQRAWRIAQCLHFGVPLAALASPDLERWTRRLGVAL